jgi:hypothetical protein
MVRSTTDPIQDYFFKSTDPMQSRQRSSSSKSLSMAARFGKRQTMEARENVLSALREIWI